MAYLVLGLGLLIGGVLLARWFASAQPKQIISGSKWVAIGLGAGGYKLLDGYKHLCNPYHTEWYYL